MPEPLKYQYNEAFFSQLIQHIQEVEPHFDVADFQDRLYAEPWEELELKARMRRITESLHDTLNRPYRELLEVLKPIAARQPYSFLYMFFPEVVEVYGQEDWEASLPALEHFTQFSSSEFAVRPFLLADQDRMMEQMLQWSQHPNEHVRRLASEGCRTRLPWGMGLPALKKDPGPILPILENLRQDPALYVRKSVANNLNDLSKDFPDLVLDIAHRWHGQHPDTDWIVKHALRTLLKQGNTQALRLFGFGDPDQIEVVQFQVTPEVIPFEGEVELHIAVQPPEGTPTKIRLEYRVGFVRKNGKLNHKVFQLSETTYSGKGKLELTKVHSFRSLSTRKHYPGRHSFELIVNGGSKAEQWVELEA
ncbi:MAG: DNA alkylation repair protein [Bacteroidota bacterium]